jgi:hypothetical protein
MGHICAVELRIRHRSIGVFLIGLLLSCASTFDTASGDDKELMGARDMVLGIPITDRVSERTHDNTDWKTFEYLGYQGRIMLDVYWDEPSVEASVSLRNQFNIELLNVKHSEHVQHERLGPVNVKAGKYYIRIQCNDGESSYTVKVKDVESQGDTGGSYDQRPE